MLGIPRIRRMKMISLLYPGSKLELCCRSTGEGEGSMSLDLCLSQPRSQDGSLGTRLCLSLSSRPFLHFAFPQKFDPNWVFQSICIFKGKKTILRKWKGCKRILIAYASQAPGAPNDCFSQMLLNALLSYH